MEVSIKILFLSRYYHRSLNPKKLVDVKFSQLGRNQTMQRLIKLMRVPEVSLFALFCNKKVIVSLTWIARFFLRKLDILKTRQINTFHFR